MEKLKQVWVYVVTALGGLLAVVGYLLSRKNKEVEALNAKIDLASTQKQADVLEVEIKTLKDKQDVNKTQIKELDKSLDILTEKRKDITEDVQKMTNPKDISSYWNNQ